MKHLFQPAELNIAKRADIRQRISNAKMGHIVTEETKLKISASKKGHFLPTEQREKISEGLKSYYQSSKAREKLSVAQKERYKKIGERRKIQDIWRRIWAQPGYKLRMSRIHKQRWQNPEFRSAISRAVSKSVKKLWQDPEYIRHQMNALHQKPNKLELQFISILNKYFPEFKYNGDCSLGIVLAGLVPDFINVNGKKEVIEVFGDYWHGGNELKWHKTELGRIMAYNSVGYNCLVIWEHDIENLSEDEIVGKMQTFFGKVRGQNGGKDAKQ